MENVIGEVQRAYLEELDPGIPSDSRAWASRLGYLVSAGALDRECLELADPVTLGEVSPAVCRLVSGYTLTRREVIAARAGALLLRQLFPNLVFEKGMRGGKPCGCKDKKDDAAKALESG